MADTTTTPRFEIVNGSPDDEAAHQFEVVNGSPDALSKGEASAALETTTRPSSARGPSTGSARLNIGPSPNRRSVAEGLETEEEERRGGMPFSWHPANFSIGNAQPAGITPTPKPTQTLAPVATPRVDVRQPRQPRPVLGSGADFAPSTFLPADETATAGREAEEANRGAQAMGAGEAEGLKQVSGVRGWRQMLGGLDELAPTVLQKTPNAKQAMRGAVDTLKGATTAATPLMIASGLGEPEIAALAAGGALAGGAGARKLAQLVHASPDAQDLAEQAGQIVGGFAGGVAHGGLKAAANPEDALTDLLWKRGYIQDNNGQPIHISSQVEARAVAQEIIRQNPQGVIGSLRTKMGAQRAAEATPAREFMGTAEAPPPPLALPPDPATIAVMQYDTMRENAAKVASGQPLTPPAPPPPPMPEITPDEIQQISSQIAKVPAAQRAPAILQAHEELSKALLQQGKLVVDGKLEIVRDPKQAENLAQRMINDEVRRIDKEKSEGELKKGSAPERFKPITLESVSTNAAPGARKTRKAQAEELAAKAGTSGNQPEPGTSPRFEVTQEPPATVEASENAQPAESQPVAAKEASPPAEEPKKAAEVAPAASEAKKPFEKGSPVTFARNMQVGKGAGKSEIIKAGTKAFVEHSDPNLNFARVRLTDGRVQSVPLRYLEAGKEEPNAGQGTQNVGAPAATPEKAATGIAEAPAGGGAPAPATAEAEPKFKHGNTQANIPADSEAATALSAARARISDSDLAGKGKETEPHVTVRYGIKGEDTAGIRKFLSEQKPFEATLGKTEKFPPSEHSDGAAVIIAPIESPELHTLNAELEKHGEFAEPSFSEYKPHATIAYVNPEKASRYVGMKVTDGKKFTVNEIAITDRNGKAENVKLEGKKAKAETKTPEYFTEKVHADKQGYVDRYLEANTDKGLVSISADRARSLFPDYAQSKEHAAANTESTNKAASTVASGAFDQAIKGGAVADGKEAVFVAGMPGAGKSSAENAFVNGKRDVGLFYEGNLSDPALLERRVKSVLDAGGKPTVVYVYAPPKTALERMIKRAGEIGRYVPIEYGAKVAANTAASIEKLYEKYGDQVDYRAIDNSTSEEGIDAVRRLAENRNSDAIRDEQHEHAKALRKSGKLSDELYERIRPAGTTGASESNRRGNGREHQEAAPSPLGASQPAASESQSKPEEVAPIYDRTYRGPAFDVEDIDRIRNDKKATASLRDSAQFVHEQVADTRVPIKDAMNMFGSDELAKALGGKFDKTINAAEPTIETESEPGESAKEQSLREKDWARAEAYKPPDGAPMWVKPVPASFWTPDKPRYSLLNVRDSTRGGTATASWDEIVARADKENLRMKEAEKQRLKMIEERQPKPGSEEYENMRARLAELEAKEKPSEDQQFFRDGVAMENGRVGSKANEYGRVVSGLANVLKNKGVKPSTNKQYWKDSGSPLYWELSDLFHNPLAGLEAKTPLLTIARAMDAMLPTKSEKIDDRGWKFKSAFDMGHSASSMEKDLAPEGKFGLELATAERGADRMRRKTDIVKAILGETDNVKKAMTAADDLEKDAEGLRDRARGAITEAKEREAATAKEQKERPFALAKKIQPIENAKWTVKNAWIRNMTKPGETPWITDGHSALNMDLAARKSANVAGERKFAVAKAEKLLEQDPKNPGSITAENMQRMLDDVTKKSTTDGKVFGYLPPEVLGKEKLSPAYIQNTVSKKLVAVQAPILRMIQDVIRPDSIKVGKPESAVAFYKDGQLAAVVMPLRDQPEIDLPAAKKVLAGELKTEPAIAPTEDNEGIVHRLLREESGLFDPGKLVEAAGRMSEFLKRNAEDTRRARNVQWDLYDLDKQHEARVLRAKQMLEQLQREGLTQDDRQTIDAHLDALEADSDNVPVPALSPLQDRILDDVLMPMRGEAEAAYKKVTEGGLTIPNYNPRQTKGKGGMLDRFLQPEEERRGGRGNLLSKQMPAKKHRVMMALENGDKRVVASIKGGVVTAWRGGKSEKLGTLQTAMQRIADEIADINKRIKKLEDERRILSANPSRMGISFERRKNITLKIDEFEKQREQIKNSVAPEDLKTRQFEDDDGNIWSVVQATKEEIEANTPVRYYHDAAASTIVNWLQAKKAEAAYDEIERIKEDPDFDKFAMKTSTGNPPKGWQTTNLPQMRGYFFEPRVAETLDWFYDKMRMGDPGAFDAINRYMRTMILLNPSQHIFNVGAQWAVQRGVTGFLPTRLYRLGKTGARAIAAVWNQNQDYLEALDAGAPLQSTRGALRDLTNLFYEQLADASEKGTPWATKIAKAIGLAPVELVKVLHKLSSKIVWPASDMLFLQAAYEYQETHPDASLHDALREVGRIIPEYRLPTRIMDSRVLAKLMSSNVATAFGAYHFGLLRSFSESAKSALGMAENAAGRSTTEEIGKGWDRLAMMALVAFGLYGIADQLAKKITGEKDAQVKRHGVFGLIQAAIEVAHHEATPTQAITKVMTPNPATLAVVEGLFNRDLRTGRHLYDPVANWQIEGTQIMEFLKREGLPQYDEITRAEHSREGWKKFAWNWGDVVFPKHGAAKLAQEIASGKMDTSAWSSEERERYYARQRALEGLREGDGKALEEGIEKGLLRPADLSRLMRRSMRTELQDKINDFSYAEVKRVYDRAVEDKDEEAQKEILPILLEKQMRMFEESQPEATTAQ